MTYQCFQFVAYTSILLLGTSAACIVYAIGEALWERVRGD